MTKDLQDPETIVHLQVPQFVAFQPLQEIFRLGDQKARIKHVARGQFLIQEHVKCPDGNSDFFFFGDAEHMPDIF